MRRRYAPGDTLAGGVLEQDGETSSLRLSPRLAPTEDNTTLHVQGGARRGQKVTADAVPAFTV